MIRDSHWPPIATCARKPSEEHDLHAGTSSSNGLSLLLQSLCHDGTNQSSHLLLLEDPGVLVRVDRPSITAKIRGKGSKLTEMLNHR